MEDAKIKKYKTDNRDLYIYDDISKENACTLRTKIDEIIRLDNEVTAENSEALKAIYGEDPSDGKTYGLIPPVRINVNTCGGTIYDGLCIYDGIKKLNKHCKVCMSGSGLVASAGVMIFLSVPCERRVCSQNTTFLIHQPWGGAFGELKSMEDSTKECKRLADVTFKIIQANTKITKKQLDDVYEKKKDWIIDADEALELGLVSAIF